MHESLRSVRFGWIGFGWFIAVATSSLILLALIGLGLMSPEPGVEDFWVGVAIAVGFLLSGFFTGTRVAAAPLLHGLGIGLCSLLAWLILTLLAGEMLSASTWGSLELASTIGLLLLQGVAAIVGTRIGVRWIRSPVENV